MRISNQEYPFGCALSTPYKLERPFKISFEVVDAKIIALYVSPAVKLRCIFQGGYLWYGLLTGLVYCVVGNPYK